jgi:hypothetical protein
MGHDLKLPPPKEMSEAFQKLAKRCTDNQLRRLDTPDLVQIMTLSSLEEVAIIALYKIVRNSTLAVVSISSENPSKESAH